MCESQRSVYGDVPPDARSLFGISADEVIKLEGSVYGLRTATKAWLQKAATDLKSLGAIQHPLDQCVFMFYSKSDPKTLLSAIWSICG